MKHTYTLDGTKILQETWPDIDATNTPCTRCLIPLYDNEDSVCGILYDDIPYYFLKNLQGDIIAITNQGGSVLARYSYDAWGVCTITSDSSDCAIATINPFRYRGYYYDAEISMYYLQSRYYNPNVGRFVNSDDAEVATISNNTLCSNLFTYCSNDVINQRDLYGNLGISSLLSVIDDAFGVIMSIAETGVRMDKAFQNLDKKIKATKTRKARKAFMKEQKKLLIRGTGKGLYFATKIIGYIVLIAPFVKYVLDWSKDRILFVEFIVAIIIEIIMALLCKATSVIIGCIPAAGVILGFAGSWLVGKMLEMHYTDRRISNIAKFFNKELPKLTSAKKWFNTFVYALSI